MPVFLTKNRTVVNRILVFLIKNHNISRILVFSTENHTVNRMLVFLSKNHIHILVFSTEIAPLVICLIFSTENAIESHILLQFHNKTFRLSAINVMLPALHDQDANIRTFWLK